MDYKTIYYKIIENAKNETENGHRIVGYYEKHHILPRSLNGTNDKNNLVKLTVREHFICHWLLVKIYPKGSDERHKMLCALWRMQSHPTKDKHRYINSRTYEYLRIEFAQYTSELHSIDQQGNKNSQFGTKWYTNRNTGESKKFKEKPIEEFWIEGRNLFHGEFDSIKTHLYARNKETRLINAKKLWNEFHSGNYNSIREFAKEKQIGKNLIMNLFKLSPFYNELFKCHYWVNSSNKNYIDKFD